MRQLAVIWLGLCLLWPGGSASGDAVSPLRIDHQVVVQVGSELTVDYSLTFNRAMAYVEAKQMDADGDGERSEAEQQAYFEQVGRYLSDHTVLRLNDAPAFWLEQRGAVELSMPFTKRYRFTATFPPSEIAGIIQGSLNVHLDAYPEIPGEVVLRFEPGNSLDVYHADHVLIDEGTPLYPRDALVNVEWGSGSHHNRESLYNYGQPYPDIYSDWNRFTWPAGLLGFVLLGLAIILRERPRVIAIVLALVVFGLAVWLYLLPPPRIDDREARILFQDLHGRIYAGFGYGGEEAYDALSEVFHGTALDTAYLQVTELKSGPETFAIRRVRPMNFQLERPLRKTWPEIQVSHRWRVYGMVSHGGHSHSRINEYEGAFTIGIVDHGWMIIDHQLRHHERIESDWDRLR